MSVLAVEAMAEVTDERQLVLRAQCGDQEALEKLLLGLQIHSRSGRPDETWRTQIQSIRALFTDADRERLTQDDQDDAIDDLRFPFEEGPPGSR